MTHANLPAFPHPSGGQGCDGLTKREYMATQILGGLGDDVPINDDGSYGSGHPYGNGPMVQSLRTQTEIMQHKAQWAVRQADALIAALGGE
jgi:hypothetical protein